MNSGTVWAWGYNRNGQLGIGKVSNQQYGLIFEPVFAIPSKVGGIGERVVINNVVDPNGCTDTMAPLVTHTFPADDATTFGVNSTIRVLFNEPMDPATINASSFLINGGAVAGAITESGV